MKLLRIHIISAETCGGLLDGLDFWFRSPSTDYSKFDPICLIGPNGAGKSQLLQILSEIFQTIFHSVIVEEERLESNPGLQFELEYLIRPDNDSKPTHIRVTRKADGKKKPTLEMHRLVDREWVAIELDDPNIRQMIPQKVVGYTSGDNETLSLPFFVSRSGYAEEVAINALNEKKADDAIPDTRLMLIDYSTHIEVFVANLILGNSEQREALLKEAQLKELRSYRCIIQLAHRAAPKAPKSQFSGSKRKGIQLTDELESYIENLKKCATCYDYDEKNEKYVFDYWMNNATREGFHYFWENILNLYGAWHKIGMLNDLAIPKYTRERFKRDTKVRRFATRLPEPQDEDKVFRFERVQLISKSTGRAVDYVSLSDGEHQLAQLLGTLSMLSSPNVIFLLDEPESHFNPQWRVKCTSRILDMPTAAGKRNSETVDSAIAEQECILTTHAPFVPSDIKRERVFIFKKEGGKIVVKSPDIETYGTRFDTILEECFEVRPPISKVSHGEIEKLRKSDNVEEIEEGIKGLGASVEKVFLADRLRQLKKKKGK